MRGEHEDDLEPPVRAEEDLDKGGAAMRELGLRKGSKREEVQVLKARCMKLRQGVSHSFNLESMCREKLHLHHVEEMRARLRDEGGKETILEQVQKDSLGPNGISKFEKGLCKLANMEPECFGGLFNMDTLLAWIENEHHIKDTICGICGEECPLETAVRAPEVSKYEYQRLGLPSLY